MKCRRVMDGEDITFLVQVTDSEGFCLLFCLFDCGILSELLLVNKISMFNKSCRIITTIDKVINLMPNVNCSMVPLEFRFAQSPINISG